MLPSGFDEMELLREEAVYYDIQPLIAEIKRHLQDAEGEKSADGNHQSPSSSFNGKNTRNGILIRVFCSDLSSDDCIQISAKKDVLEEAFPETSTALENGGVGLTSSWEFKNGYVHGFPLTECRKFKFLCVFERLLNLNFRIENSCKGEMNGFHFMEHLFVR